MIKKIIPLLSVLALVSLFCTKPENPLTNPNNAFIVKERSLKSLPSNLKPDTVYQCSLYVVLPELCDSFSVKLIHGTQKTTIIADTFDATDTLITFSLSRSEPGIDTIIAYLYKPHNKVDSIISIVWVKSFPTSIVNDSAFYNVRIKDSVTVKIKGVDPDGDFKQLLLFKDSAGGSGSVYKFTNRADSTALVNITIRMPAFDTITFYAQAEDSAGNTSKLLTFKVAGYDTAKPVITITKLSPVVEVLLDTVVKTLPCSLYVKVQDFVPIDSLKFNNTSLVLQKDTGFIAISQLDSGVQSYTIRAWDRNGNTDSIKIKIRYTGATMYKPLIETNLKGQVDSIAHPFTKIYLDSCVTINPLASYTKNNLKWTLIQDYPDSGIQFTLDTLTRTVTIAVPDTYWTGTEKVAFICSAPNALTDQKMVTFLRIDEPPVITRNGQCKTPGTSFDTISVDSIVADRDDQVNTLTWSFDTTKAKYFTFQRIYKQLVISTRIDPIEPLKLNKTSAGMILPPYIRPPWARQWAVVPKAGVVLPIGAMSDTMSITVTDPTNSSSTTSNYILSWNSICEFIIKP